MLGKFQFQVFPSSGLPIYRQIIDQILAQISSGRLAEGDMLPAVRQVAIDLQINPMTISKAYSYLEHKGVVELIRGKGMRIKVRNPKESLDERKSQVRSYFENAFAKSHQLSLSKNDVLDVIQPMLEVLGKINRKDKS